MSSLIKKKKKMKRKKLFSFDQVKNNFSHFGGLTKIKNNFKFQIFILANVFWSKRKDFVIF